MQHHPRLSEALEKYLAMRQARFAKQSAINDGYVLTRFLAWLGEDIQVRNLKPERVEAYFYGPEGLRREHVTRDGKTRPGISEATHSHYRSRLKILCAYCTQNGWRSLTSCTETIKKPSDRTVTVHSGGDYTVPQPCRWGSPLAARSRCAPSRPSRCTPRRGVARLTAEHDAARRR